MKLKEVLDRTVQFFKDKNIETPRLDTEILLTEALGFESRIDLYLKFDQPLKDDELARSREFVRRRSQGEPIAYIIGKKDFCGFEFIVSPDVLIPRPETELLVEEAARWISKNSISKSQILDLGCGSGCIGLSVLAKVPDAQLVSIDKSAAAISIAKKNAEKLGLAERVKFIESDISAEALPNEKFDIVLSNPPYIAENDPEVQAEVIKFEPHQALFAGENGLGFLYTWSRKAAPLLKDKAMMGFEMGWTQSSKMREHFTSLAVFDNIEILKDLSGIDRQIVGEKHG